MVLGRQCHPNLTLYIQPACMKQVIVATYRHFKRQRAGEKEQRSCHFSDKQFKKESIAPCFHGIYKAMYGFRHQDKYCGETMHLSKQRMHIYPCVFKGKGKHGAPRNVLSKSKRTMKPTLTSALTETSRLPQKIRQ